MPEEKPNAGIAASQAPTQHHKSHFVPTVIVIVVAALLGFLLYRLITKKPKASPPMPPTRVSTTNAAQGDIGVYVSALGLVTPLATVTVVSQVTGQLSQVNFTEGETVTNGQLLAVVDERPFQAALTTAQGQLERDQALLAEARMDMQRYKSASNAVPRQQYEDQLALVHQYEGAVKNDRGLVDNATVQLGFCRIASPVFGRVGLRLVDPGNVVQSGSTNGIAVLTQLQPITIIFSVAEDYLPEIKHQLGIGNRMTVEAYDRAQEIKIGSGNVLALDNQIDNTTGTVRLRSVFDNASDAFFPNQFVNVSLLLDTLHGKTLIPSYAVQRNGQAAFVYVVKTNQTVEMRTIKTDATDGNVTAVEGLNPGETIVTDNFNRLQDGARISVRKPGDGEEGKAGAAGKKKAGGSAEQTTNGSGRRNRGGTNAPKP